MISNKTVTTIFMVPTLGINKQDLVNNNFINAYSKDASREVQYEDCIYLVFKPKDTSTFREFLDREYTRTAFVVDDYDYKDCVIVVYKLDPKYRRDFDLVRMGKYSLTSNSFQALFPRVVKIIKNNLHKDEISLQYRVFNRTEDMIKFWEEKLDVRFDRDQEVWTTFCEENETLNLENIYINI